MKVYKVEYQDYFGEHKGYGYFPNYRKALAAKTEYQKGNEGYTATIELISVQPTKTGIVKALNVYASHPDNG